MKLRIPYIDFDCINIKKIIDVTNIVTKLSKDTDKTMKGGSRHYNSYNKGMNFLYNKKYSNDSKIIEFKDKFTRRTKINNNNNRKTRKIMI